MEKGHAFILSLLLTLLIAVNVFFFSYQEGRRSVQVSRIIDGDTLVLKSGEVIRLLNINAPEKGAPGFEKSKEFLSKLENTTIEIETSQKDKYGRTLARIYTPQYLNLEIVRQGFATKFLVDKKEIEEYYKAELLAIENELGMWKKSQHSDCFTSEINTKNEVVLLINICDAINIKGWIITDESRKQYKFPELVLGQVNLHTFNGTNNDTDLFWNSKTNIWNNDRDSVYIFDPEGKLVHYKTYGY